MIRATGDVPLRNDPASRYLPWTVGLLVFLATLALAVGMVLASAGEMWRQNLSGTLTVQIPPVVQLPDGASDGAPLEDRVAAALESLRRVPGVTAAAPLSSDRIGAMLEPWLGKDALRVGLPMPVLIDVQTDPSTSIDLAALATALSAASPGATLDDHASWLRRLSDFALAAQAVSFAVILVILISAVATVIFTTRTGLAIHRDVVEVLHLIGARDSYVAWQFQLHTSRLAAVGAAAGFALGAGAVYALEIYGSGLSGGLLPDLALNDIQWAVLCALPVAAVLLVMFTVGFTVTRTLGRMA